MCIIQTCAVGHELLLYAVQFIYNSSLPLLPILSECMGDIEEVVLEHPVMDSDLSDPANGATALKHIRQQV